MNINTRNSAVELLHVVQVTADKKYPLELLERVFRRYCDYALKERRVSDGDVYMVVYGMVSVASNEDELVKLSHMLPLR